MDFIGANGDGGGGDKWNCKTCKAPVKMSPSSNLTPSSFTGRIPFLSPNRQCQSTEGKVEDLEL